MRTVVVVDLVESVRLMQANESDVIDRWRRFVHQAREQVLGDQGARLVKSLGDGMLLEFRSIAAAVDAAQALLALMQQNNRERPDGPVLRLRVGVHCAEVVVDDDDIYGAGVNLAARLASLAQPDQIVVSAEVQAELRDQVHGRIADLGYCYLKHIEEPVRAFAVAALGEAAQAAEHAPQEWPELPASVAVIPFACSAEQQALGVALADEVIAALSRGASALRVVSRLSTAPFSGRPTDLAQLGRMLKVRYVVSGQCYTDGDRVRVSYELCELPGARVLLADSLKAEIPAIFAGEDEMVPRLVASLGRCIAARELSRVRSLPMQNLEGFTLYLGATGLMNSLAPQDFGRAKEVLDHLAYRYPRQASPHAMLTKWHVFKQLQGWAVDAKDEALRAREQAYQALQRDPDEASAWVADGLVKVTFDNDVEAGAQSYRRALQLSPQDSYAWAILSGAHCMLGQHAEALHAVRQALDLSPLDPCLFLYEAYGAMATLCLGDFEAAVRHGQASVRHNTVHAPSHRLLVSALWHSGRHQEAREAAAVYLKLVPGASVRASLQRRTAASTHYTELMVSGLRGAGIPE